MNQIPVITLALVEDDYLVRRALSRDLKSSGFEVVQTTGGLDILDKLSLGLKPELILMDLLMPGIDGYEATRLISIKFKDVKIVALTAFMEYSGMMKFKNLGGHGYILKPWDHLTLSKIILDVISGKEYFPENQSKDYLPQSPF